MTNPQVTVIVEQINSQRIYILGEANHIGTYTLAPQMTILQALSNAGGCSPFANTKKIYVMRTVNGKQVKFFFNYTVRSSRRVATQNKTSFCRTATRFTYPKRIERRSMTVASL